MSGFTIAGDNISTPAGTVFTLDQMGSLAESLPWVTANVIIMPPHQYVVEMKLETERHREIFRLLEYACAHHPAAWRAYFRAYKTRNRYLTIGSYRYWYTQIRAARMLNRCDKASELENTRAGAQARPVKNWRGCAYAWKSEYGLRCENVENYCNLVVAELRCSDDSPPAPLLLRYAPMVPLSEFKALVETLESGPGLVTSTEAAAVIIASFQRVEPLHTKTASNSHRAPTLPGELTLSVPWLKQRDMDIARVAADLRWLSGAPQPQVSSVIPLSSLGEYLVQLRIPPAA
jgi:hypothetical protein